MPKTVLITGASSGIGLATAKLFHSRGWNVIASMRDPSSSSAAALGQLDGSRLLLTQLDLSVLESIAPAVQAGRARFGEIDVLINNAGYGQFGVFEMMSRETYQKQFDVNLFGAMEVIRAVLPHMRARGRGQVINISSGAGVYGLPLATAYCASKFALEGFTEALHYELHPHGIVVKLVTPHTGVRNTQFQRAAEKATGVSNEDPSLVAAYGKFAQGMLAKFNQISNHVAITSDDVAMEIFKAATDGERQLRYIVPHEESMFMKGTFDVKADIERLAIARGVFEQ